MSNGLPAPAVWSLFIVHRLLSAMRQMGFSRARQRTAQGHVCAFSSDLYVMEKTKYDRKCETCYRKTIPTLAGTRKVLNTPYCLGKSAFGQINEPIVK